MEPRYAARGDPASKIQSMLFGASASVRGWALSRKAGVLYQRGLKLQYLRSSSSKPMLVSRRSLDKLRHGNQYRDPKDRQDS